MLVILCRFLSTFQSTLPRGSDKKAKEAAEAKAISIHAPSRERRGKLAGFRRIADISIHAPSRERPQSGRGERGGNHFNPRSLAGAT